MPSKKDLSRDQRDAIEDALTQDPDVSWALIGREVGVHPTTAMREVSRNRGRVKYSAEAAQCRAERELFRPRELVLAAETPLRAVVIEGLTSKKSPAVIAADLRAAGGARVCAETIYQSVYRGCFPLKARECLRTRRPRRRGRQERHPNRRAGLPNIVLRPEKVNDRSEPGHLELDLIIGKNNQSALLCGIERVTRYGAILILPDGYRAESVLAAICELFDQIPPHLRRSVTFDQGSEWADWECLVEHYRMQVWFCDPHSPWQRGAIENYNGHARYWFPRGSDHGLVSAQRADEVTGFINTQRRRSLGWDTPEQRWIAQGGVVLASPQTRLASGLILPGS